jgi:hypothetical protein
MASNKAKSWERDHARGNPTGGSSIVRGCGRPGGYSSVQPARFLERHRACRDGRSHWGWDAVFQSSGRAHPSGIGAGGGARSRERTAISEVPRQERRPRRARRPAARGRDAGKPARRRHHADRKILHPEQRPDSRRDEGRGQLEDHHRRRGQQQGRDHARRVEEEIQSRNAARRRAATSGPMAAPAAPNGPACGLPTCSRPPA